MSRIIYDFSHQPPLPPSKIFRDKVKFAIYPDVFLILPVQLDKEIRQKVGLIPEKPPEK